MDALDPTEQVTQLLAQINDGDQNAANKLVPLLYSELRRLAGSYLRSERGDHTLQATALVNEAYLRLVNQREAQWNSRNHFFAIAAQVMRRILVDYARVAKAEKRGGAEPTISLDALEIGCAADLDEFLALNEAIERLAAFSPRQARVIELRYFGGLNLEEMAGLLEVSPATVSREQKLAEAWLSRAMEAPRS